MSNVLNITVDQGTNKPYTFNLFDKNNAPYNLAGFDARLMVRKAYGDAVPQISATVANGMLYVDPTFGTVAWNIDPADTSSIRFDNPNDDTLDCVYDLQIISSDGKVYRVAAGTLTINRAVTR